MRDGSMAVHGENCSASVSLRAKMAAVAAAAARGRIGKQKEAGGLSLRGCSPVTAAISIHLEVPQQTVADPHTRAH